MMDRRRFIQLSLAGVAAINVPWKLFPPPEVKLVLNAEVLRKVAKLMKEYEIPVFADRYWHVDLHPDAEFDLLGDKTIASIYQDYEPEEDGVVGMRPRFYGFKFYRDMVKVGRGELDVIRHARWSDAITVIHRSSMAEHKDDLYPTHFYGPGAGNETLRREVMRYAVSRPFAFKPSAL